MRVGEGEREEVKSKHAKDCWLYRGCPTAAVATCQKPKSHYYFEYQFTYILEGSNKCLTLLATSSVV